MRLGRIQQDCCTGINRKQLIGPEYHDYSEHDQYREHAIDEHAIYTEERGQVLKQTS